jgi:catechol 2,3-dioxygenase
MTPAPVIAAMSHLAIRVRDVAAAVRTATTILGMREVARDDEWVYLTCNHTHHVLQYAAGEIDAVDHVGLTAASPEALTEVLARVRARGLPVISEAPLDAGFAHAITFVGADGFVYEVGIDMPADHTPYLATGVRPTHFGHVNLHVADVSAAAAFAREVLDFRVSDVVTGRGVFLRCNSEHHAIAYLQGPGVLHHHAWAVASVGHLAQLGDILDDRGQTLLWGPLRHGAGDNVAVYFADSAGAVVEVYAEMEAILDERGFAPRTWDNDDPRWWSRWAKIRGEGFHDFGLPPAQLRSLTGVGESDGPERLPPQSNLGS